jgi:hypothetical protein
VVTQRYIEQYPRHQRHQLALTGRSQVLDRLKSTRNPTIYKGCGTGFALTPLAV